MCIFENKILYQNYVSICFVAAKMKALKPVKDEPLTGVKEARYSMYFIIYVINIAKPGLDKNSNRSHPDCVQHFF